MSPRGFTNSTVVHLQFRQWEQDRFNAFLKSIDPHTRVKLGQACPYVIQLVKAPKSRKSLGLTKFCALFIEQSFARSSTALAVSAPTRLSSSAIVLTTAVGLICVVSLFKILDPSSPRISSKAWYFEATHYGPRLRADRYCRFGTVPAPRGIRTKKSPRIQGKD